MVITCAILGCKSSKNKNPDVGFFRIPSRIRNYCDTNSYLQELSETRNRAWLKAIRRNLKSEKCTNRRVCSLHFYSGKPAYLKEYDNIDWAPSRNLEYTPSPVKITPSFLKNLSTRRFRKTYTSEEIAKLNILRNYGTQTEITGGVEEVSMECVEADSVIITKEGLLIHSVGSQTLPTEAEINEQRTQLLAFTKEVKSLNKKIEMLTTENDLLKKAFLNDIKIN